MTFSFRFDPEDAWRKIHDAPSASAAAELALRSYWGDLDYPDAHDVWIRNENSLRVAHYFVTVDKDPTFNADLVPEIPRP